MTPTTDKRQDLDQRRARHAWKVIERVIEDYGKGEKAKQVGRAAKKLPARVMAAGLGQALAFLLAKGKTPLLLAALGDWVLDAKPAGRSDPQLAGPDSDRRLIRAIMERESVFLRQATDEVLAYLRWLTRFADAEDLTSGEDDT